jgi:hypothetical protein
MIREFECATSIGEVVQLGSPDEVGFEMRVDQKVRSLIVVSGIESQIHVARIVTIRDLNEVVPIAAAQVGQLRVESKEGPISAQFHSIVRAQVKGSGVVGAGEQEVLGV